MSGPRLYIDIQTIQSLRFGDRGIPRLATELSRALLARDAPVAALALNPLIPWPSRLHPDLARAPQLTWNTATAFRRALRDGPVVNFVISPFEGARPVHATLAAHVTGVPEIIMVHDLIPDLVGYDPQSEWGRLYLRRRAWVRRAEVIVTPSENTRRDLITRWEMDPARITVIGEAASPFFCLPGPGDDPAGLIRRALPAITRPFVLCVSGPDQHKNTATLIEAWARAARPVHRDLQLVVACTLPDDTRQAWTAHAEAHGVGSDELVFTGFVEDDVLRALYRQASLFVLPSRYEGFGLPVLEAIACGCPAITSSASSLPEVLDWPEAAFTPSDPDEIAGLIERAVADSEYRAELDEHCRRAAARHTWQRVVDRLLGVRADLPAPSRSRPRRLRIALVGPFPPTPTWSASYDAQVADHLGRHCELDCFTEHLDGDAGLRGTARAYRMFPAAALCSRLTPAAYDLVLYVIGSAPGDASQLARLYPGVLWLHDLALADRELVERSRGAIVDSRRAQELLEEDLGPVSGTPTWVLPTALSDDAYLSRAQRGSDTHQEAIPPTIDEVARRILEIARLDLEPASPEQAPPVSAPAPAA